MNYVQVGQANNSPSSLAGAGQQTATQGSLAEAFQQLDKEVSILEGACKAVFERVGPFLEPAPPTNEANAKEAPRGASPLADSVFEYVARIRRNRKAIEEIVQRIAY